MARLLSAAEVAAARSELERDNSRLRPRLKHGGNWSETTTDDERRIWRLLDSLEIRHQVEVMFLPTQHDTETRNGRLVEVEYGFAPDIGVIERDGQVLVYIEVSHGRKNHLRDKRRKISNAERIHDVGILLCTASDLPGYEANPELLVLLIAAKRLEVCRVRAEALVSAA